MHLRNRYAIPSSRVRFPNTNCVLLRGPIDHSKEDAIHLDDFMNPARFKKIVKERHKSFQSPDIGKYIRVHTPFGIFVYGAKIARIGRLNHMPNPHDIVVCSNLNIAPEIIKAFRWSTANTRLSKYLPKIQEKLEKIIAGFPRPEELSTTDRIKRGLTRHKNVYLLEFSGG